MENYNLNNQYQYDNGQKFFVCPFVQNSYGITQPTYRDMNLEEQPQVTYYDYQVLNGYEESNPVEDGNRAPRDVNRVASLVEREAAAEIRELERIGINRRLLGYMVTSMISYIDRSYNRFTGPMQTRIEMALRDIRRDLHYLFDIFQVMGASPATVGRLADIVVRTSLRNLRPAPPAPHPGPGHPMQPGTPTHPGMPAPPPSTPRE